MKKFRNILFLSALVSGIVFLWLIPKTKGEKKTQYVRIYTKERKKIAEEDSSKTEKSNKVVESKKRPLSKKIKQQREIVQIDTLNGELGLEDIQPSLYSRSMHFKRVKQIEPKQQDSAYTKVDTVKSVTQ